jgi:hypothetical protein
MKNPRFINFLFDGSNYRGYEAEFELILKVYKNNISAVITSDILFEEN